eukprot:11063117-Heterocapsa_arctica.AAC.1
MEKEEQRKQLKRLCPGPGLEEDESKPKLKRSARLVEKRRRDPRAELEQEEEKEVVCGTVAMIVKEKYESHAD